MYFFRQISFNRRVIARALSVLLLLITTSTPSLADPIPKKKEEMILWAFRNKTSELMFFGVEGKKRKTQVVKGGQSFVGLTEDGSHIIYIGKAGEPSSFQNDYTTFHTRSLDASKVKDLNIPATRDGYHFNMSKDLKHAYGVKATKSADGKVLHEYVYWDMQKMKMILLDVPENTRIIGFTPDNQSYYGIRFNTDELFTYYTFSINKLTAKPVFPKDKQKMISVAFSPEMNSVLGDVEVINDRNGRQEFVVSNFSLTTGQSTAFIRSPNKFEVTCHFSPDGNYVGRYIIKYKGDLNRAVFDHGEIEISNAMGTEIKSLLRLEQPENISFGWIKQYVNP